MEAKPETEQIRYDIGCGLKPLPGYRGIDHHLGHEAYPLDLPDNHADEIRASHVLEHFSHTQTLNVVKDWVRALKPGGRLRIAVPDFSVLCEMYLRGEQVPIMAYVMGGQIAGDDYHKAIFDRAELEDVLRQCGLTSVRPWVSDALDCSQYPFSLNLEGFKRQPLQVKGVTAVMSLPRLTFTDNALCWAKALVPHGINLITSHGVFWGHAITNSIEQAIAQGATYALAIDYDSVFTKHDVTDLFALMQDNPDAFAVCACQSRREADTVLMTLGDGKGGKRKYLDPAELSGDLLPIESGHFGLTMIRLSMMDKLPKPWFQDVPNADGRWQEGRVDEDVFFWKQARRCGLNIYQANRVLIGHIQRMVSWPTRSLRPLHQYLSDYEKQGMPREIAR